MNGLHSIIVLAAAIVAVFCEASFGGVRRVLGAQPDLLPCLMIYAGLSTGLTTVVLLSVIGGLSFDALSANPFGVTIMPLIVVGLIVHGKRELILRDQVFAQFVLGTIASGAVPLMTVLMLLTLGHAPLLGWWTAWQWLVMTVAGGIATPALFYILEWCDRAVNYRRVSESSFRSDREIRRRRRT